MPASGPSVTEIKKLFARSGNRCAFPKCIATIIHERTVLGEVAHIKGLNPTSARHDPMQTPEERNEYDNLILLCPNHHTVIDDDQVSYPLERLYAIKAAHEGRVTPVSEGEANRDAPLLLIPSVTVSGVGIVTGVVQNQNVVLPPTTDVALQTRRISAIERLWAAGQRFKQEFSDLVFADTVLTAQELDQYFRTRRNDPILSNMLSYSEPNTVPEKFTRADNGTASERPFINPRAWGVFHVLKTVYGRSGMLFSLSYKQRAYQDWRKDDPLDHLLRAVLPAHIVSEAKAKEIGGLRFLIEHLEVQFMEAANIQP